MTHIAEHSIAAGAIAGPPRRRARLRLDRPPRAVRPPRCRDARWPALAAALDGLRAGRRRSVRIVDAGCGSGGLLLCAVRYARALGFTAIEARGIDHAAAPVGRARAAAATLHDPAIGITFETADLVRALGEETDLPADIILWRGTAACGAAVARAVACAGHVRIAAPRGIAAESAA